MIRKAIIPAAGLGTRLLPATRAVPKPLLPLVNRPAIDYVIDELAGAGIAEVAVVLSPSGEALRRHLLGGQWPVTFSFTVQDEPKGLGHAVLMGEDFAGNESVAVLLPDDLFPSGGGIGALLGNAEQPGVRLGLMEVAPDQVSRYGIVSGSSLKGGGFRVTGLVEKPPADEAPSNLAVLGRYVLPPDVFRLLKTTRPGAKGEIQLTDAIARYVSEGGPATGVILSSRRYDVGDVDGYRAALLDVLRQG